MLVVVLKDWVIEMKETPCGVEQLDQFGEVGERTGQPVDLVDDDDVDPALPDGVEQGLQGRTVETCRPNSRRRHSGRERGPSPHEPGCGRKPHRPRAGRRGN